MTRIIIVSGNKPPVLMESEKPARELVDQIHKGLWDVEGNPEGVTGSKLRVHRLEKLVVVVDELLEGAQGKWPYPSKRQREVLQGLGDGLASKEIARQLGISKRTVDFHIATLMGLLKANTRTEMLGKAKEKGW
jgi:DNA-binding CsgD family transcriptional regulator